MTLMLKRLVGSQRRGGYDDDDIDPRGDDDNDTTISLAMATATRVAGNEEGDGGARSMMMIHQSALRW